METTLYYTLSTIAQTLAGALAVLVAFVLFKLSGLDGAMHLAQYELQGQYGSDWRKLWDALCAGGLEGLEKEAQAHVDHPRLRAAYQAGRIAFRMRPRITRRLYVALGFSVADIALCFILLPFAPALKCHPHLVALVLTLTVGLGIVCLLLYVWLIAAMVEGAR